MAKTALFVSYMFPPVGGVGTIRAVKFIRYLKAYGWDVVVLTVKDPAYAFYDEALCEDIPDDTPIYRSRAFQPTARYFAGKRQGKSGVNAPTGILTQLKRMISPIVRRVGRFVVQNVMIPDDKIGWYPFAIREGQRILNAHTIDVIFSSSSPLTTHAIAHRLSSQSGIPWVADFRDPMTGEGSVVKRSRLHRWLFARLERSWVKQARRVISVTEPMCQLFIDRYPHLSADKWVVITNGYDEAVFADVVLPEPSPYFEIHYIGSLYEGMFPSLHPLFEAIVSVRQNNPYAHEKFRLVFTGKMDAHAQAYIEDAITHYGLAEAIVTHPSVPHTAAMQRMLGADVLLVVLKIRIAIHVKVFEYLRARKPILALMHPSAAYDVLKTMDGAAVIAPDDQQAIAHQLQTWFTAWQAGALPQPTNIGHEQYERRALTAKLATLFDDCMAKTTS